MGFIIVPVFFALASEYVATGKAGVYNVEVRINKNQPARGLNHVDIAVTDAASKPVTDVQVHIEYLMPSLPGRPPMMEYSATAKPDGHSYQAEIDLSMAGEWTVIVKVTRAGKTDTMQFTFVVK